MIADPEQRHDAGVVEKVTRLLDVLSEIGRHPLLSKKVCLHGGTAINLFMLDAPRLSTDADITYIGDENPVIETERESVEAALQDVGSFLGYNVTASKETIAGRTFRLRYAGSRGADFIKIDINYLNRVPLQPVLYSECYIEKSIRIKTLSRAELIAGKTKALFDRVVVRDIYDISQIYRLMGELFDLTNDIETRKLRRTILFYAALSHLFPVAFEGITENRFTGRDKQIRNELYPVLAVDDRPSLKDLISGAESFVKEYVTPKDNVEAEYLERFEQADYCPGLLFEEWPDVLIAAEKNPPAKWKILNLARKEMQDYDRGSSSAAAE